ncbi:MAG: DUF4258 domain-containing protein [Dehalococcoidia bacterium]
MELRYSGHALEQLIAREITEEMLDAVLLNPRWMPSVGPNACYDGIVGDRRLRIVIAEEHPVPVLVTAHWVEEEPAP